MFKNPCQVFNSSLPEGSGPGKNSAPLRPQAGRAKAADFTDRQLEAYFLPNPANPSASLQALYAAVRKQMVADGCD